MTPNAYDKIVKVEYRNDGEGHFVWEPSERGYVSVLMFYNERKIMQLPHRRARHLELSASKSTIANSLL